jgi:hypothetical protein
LLVAPFLYIQTPVQEPAMSMRQAAEAVMCRSSKYLHTSVGEREEKRRVSRASRDHSGKTTLGTST